MVQISAQLRLLAVEVAGRGPHGGLSLGGSAAASCPAQQTANFGHTGIVTQPLPLARWVMLLVCLSYPQSGHASFCFWQSLLTCLTCVLNHCGSQALLMVGSDYARV